MRRPDEEARAIAEGLNNLGLLACPRLWPEFEALVDRRALALAGLRAAQLFVPTGPALTCFEEASVTSNWDAALTERLRAAARAILERPNAELSTRGPCAIHGSDCPSLPTTVR